MHRAIPEPRESKKTSIRLVWSAIIVDRKRAEAIRDVMVARFNCTQEPEITAIQERMVGDNPENKWHTVFSDSIYGDRYGVRMPLNDRVSPAPLKKPENRPLAPWAVVRFMFADGKFQSAEKVCEKNDIEGKDWLNIGCVRREIGTALTEWTPPSSAQRIPRAPSGQANDRSGAPGAGGYGGVSRDPGGVRIRTRGGSGETERRGPRPSGAPRTVETTITVEREFDGSLAQFRQNLETHLGKEFTCKEEDGRLKWSSEDGAMVDFKEANRRVYIVGKPFQIRTLLAVIAPFVKEVGNDARSVVSSRVASRAGSTYAPSTVYAPSQAYAPSAASVRQTTKEPKSAESTNRVCTRLFEAAGTGELTLAVGDVVQITHDPEVGETANLHRWVYGHVASGTAGWFPLSNTTPA